MVIYFSGTGNSRYAAEYIRNITKDKLVNAGTLIKDGRKGETFTSEKPFIFVSPAYGWRIPRVFSDFIKNSTFQGSKSAYFVVTCGTDIGDAARYLEKLSAYKQFKLMGAAAVVMPENYIAMFDVPSPEESERILLSADREILSIASKINNEEPLPQRQAGFKDKIKSSVVNPIFYTFLVKAKGFYSTEQCVGCGKCERICPMNNVRLEKSRPLWGNRCTHCMACICGCPKEAIEYKKISFGKARYFNDRRAPKI